MSLEEPTQQGSLTPSPSAGGELTSSNQDDRTMSMIAHLGGGIGGFLVPLIVWLIKKEQSKFIEQEGKEALNFQLNILVYQLIALIPSACLFGVPTLAIYVYGLVMGIIAGLKANKGEPYRYPATIRVIK